MGKRTNTARWIESAGRWQVNVQNGGVRKTFTSSIPGRAGQREANAKADAWLDAGLELSRKTLSQIFPEYLAGLKARTSKGHWKNVEYRWRVWAEPCLGRLKPDVLNDQKLQAVIAKAYSEGKLSRKSLLNIRSDLAAFCKYLRKVRISTYRPEDIAIPNGARVAKKRILQPEDIIKLFATDTTERYGKQVRDPYINAYRFQVLTGLRPGELLGLMPTDISGNKVSLQRSINIFNDVTSGKNDNARRTFYLTPTARAILTDQLSRCSGIYVFDITNEQSYRKRWKRYCEVNGIPYISPYEMRHTFVSVVQDLPEGWVKSLVGHSRNMDTFGVYGHTVTGQKEKIAAGVEQIFRDILAGQKHEAK